MATINLGNIKFNWQGTYAGGTSYNIDDVVFYNGSSYICKLASTGNVPTNTTYWDQMSSAGTNGTNGTDLTSTLTTQGDIVYRDASGLQRLGAGTAGQLLQSGGSGANVSWTDAPQGIAEADMWRFTADISNISVDPISANLERVDNASFAKIGTGMSVSSGIWTFPRTGLYKVTFYQTANIVASSKGITISYSGNSGSTWDVLSFTYIAGTVDSGVATAFVNITDTSTQKVKFALLGGSGNDFYGNTSNSYNNFEFIRIGDSQ